MSNRLFSAVHSCGSIEAFFVVLLSAVLGFPQFILAAPLKHQKSGNTRGDQ